MPRLLAASLFALGLASSQARAEARYVETPYAPPRAVFDFYFDEPQKIGPALFWVRALVNTLGDAPYAYPPEDMRIVVVIHGAEIVTLAKKNVDRYPEAVERMRYYAGLGVQFRVCGQAAADYGYRVTDFQDFVVVVPNAISELGHWQQQGYAQIVPRLMEKRFSIEAIR